MMITPTTDSIRRLEMMRPIQSSGLFCFLRFQQVEFIQLQLLAESMHEFNSTLTTIEKIYIVVVSSIIIFADDRVGVISFHRGGMFFILL
jgi:hypothetical protein